MERGTVPNPGHPSQREEAPPLPAPGALVPRRQRPKLARKSVRYGVVDRSHTHIPRAHAKRALVPRRLPQEQTVGGERVPDPGYSSQRQEPATMGLLVPPPHPAMPACKSVRCGAGDGFPCPHPCAPKKTGQQAPAARRKDGRLGKEECPTPDNPERGTRRCPPGTVGPPPERAKPAPRSVHCGVGYWSPRPHPPGPRKTGGRPRPAAPRMGGPARKSAPPRTPLTEA